LTKRGRRGEGISRIPGYVLNQRVTFRLGEFELAMLYSLMHVWKCNTSEALRRCVVYTFSKLIAGVEKFDEESVTRALKMALEISTCRRLAKSEQ